ncbi:thioredoxin family protein [Saccharopolyspora sp. K220]|uniref:thioredoxin family protein n=1 Tax=Saccharopolyspora soli TaxID=2926618 RepID=UPI001F561E98|nr:thioredoxin family protein [Saccharopolyspora soli]MCI2419254.1 thioredoxin family protein [Saccharopolyspora soli]
MNNEIKKIGTADFDAAIGEPGRTLVLFTAPWCVVCRGIEPDVRRLAEENPWDMAVRRVVVDDDPDVAARFDVRSVPSALVFADGELVARIQPRQPGELRAAVETALAE